MAHDLAVTLADAVRVATELPLAVSCSIPTMTGRADQIGRKSMFPIGTLPSTGASLAWDFSPSFGPLVAGRVRQCVAAVMLFAVAIPIYRRIFPPERLGFVLGMNAMAVAGSAVAVIMSIVTMRHLTAH